MLSPAPVLAIPAPFPAAGGELAHSQLLDRLGPLDGSHVLVLGGGPDLMGELVRRGCLAVTMLRPMERPEAAAYDVVLVAQVVEEACLDRLVYQLRRALVPTGEIIARVAGLAQEVRARRLALRLRLNGFAGVQACPSGGAVLVRASLPDFTLGARA